MTGVRHRVVQWATGNIGSRALRAVLEHPHMTLSGVYVRATGRHVVVDGDAPLDIDMRFPVPLERMGAVSPSYTANRAVNPAVNAVPFVCAAPPGIRSTADLPQITATLS